MNAHVPSVTAEIDTILYSIADELDIFIHKLGSDIKITGQDFELFVQNLERRDHALDNRLTKAQALKVDYFIPDSLRARLVKEILTLENDRGIRSRIEQVVAKHAVVWTVLKKIENTIRSERYKIKVDKTESGPSTR